MNIPPLPRRILMTTDTVGEVFDYAVELSTVLSRRGVEVLLATLGAPLTGGQLRALEAIDGLKIFESRFQLELMDEPWGDVDAAGEWLLELENSTRPDIVHLNGYVHGALPWRAPCVVVGHSCVLSWWRAVLGEPAPVRLHEYERRVRRGLRHAALVVTPSAALLRSLHELYGPLEKTRVIYHGRSALDFEPGDKEPFVLSVGKLWDAGRNVRLVDQAAARLAWPVLVAGNVEQTGTSSNHPPCRLNHARFLGSLDADEVKRTLSRASIYVHPALYEPFGLAILEAALAGCALVLGDIPSLREIWREAAIFVPTDDAARLNRELVRLIGNIDERTAWAERARRAARHYTPSRMAAEYLAAYRQVMCTSNAHRDEKNSVFA